MSFLGLPQQRVTDEMASTREIYFLTVTEKLEVQDSGAGRAGLF